MLGEKCGLTPADDCTQDQCDRCDKANRSDSDNHGAEATGDEKGRGLVCVFCGQGFGYAGEKPDKATLKAAIDHEAACPRNPYLEEITRLKDLLTAALPHIACETQEQSRLISAIGETLYTKD